MYLMLAAQSTIFSRFYYIPGLSEQSGKDYWVNQKQNERAIEEPDLGPSQICLVQTRCVNIVINYSWKEVYPQCASLTWGLTKINPSTWDSSLIREILYKIAINKVISV